MVVFLGVVLLLPCSTALHMFHYFVIFRLFGQYSVFCQCPGVPPVFRCCARVPCSMFRCSWFYSMSFKMNLIMYSTKKQLLINIQKSHAPNPITPCYCTSNWHYTRYIQPKLYFLSDKDCIDCFLPDIWLEGMWMIFIFYFLDFQVVFFLQIFGFF